MILVDIEKEDVELTKKMVCSMGGEAIALQADVTYVFLFELCSA